jgi:N-acetylglucosamine kinase-like BadF-type ATPase
LKRSCGGQGVQPVGHGDGRAVTFLGIDGGGSKTTFLLEDSKGQELARTETGPSNWLSAGSDEVRESLAAGIARLPTVPDVACGGFAGAGRPSGVAFYRGCLESLLPQTRVLIESDAFISYIGAIGIQPGVLLIAGTGAIAIARANDGNMIRVGGWGSVFGDEGGGYWIGREAVSAALRANDAGTFPEFIAAVVSTLELRHITEAPVAWKSGEIDVRSVAGVARVVIEQHTTEPGKQILREAAAYLRHLTELARERAELPPSCLKSISGSVGTNPLMQELIGVAFSAAANPPAKGAILWARDRIRPS